MPRPSVPCVVVIEDLTPPTIALIGEHTDAIARVWRTAGRASIRFDDRPPFS